MKNNKTCLHPLSKALALPRGEVLNDICVGIMGSWDGHAKGSFSIGMNDFTNIIKNHENSRLDIVIDYEHQSLSGGEAPAAGWIKELYVKEDKLYARVVWSDRAREYIRAGEYKYLSPVFEFNAKSQKSAQLVGTRLHSCAITNKPFLDELGELVANALNNETNSSQDGLSSNEQLEKYAEPDTTARCALGGCREHSSCSQDELGSDEKLKKYATTASRGVPSKSHEVGLRRVSQESGAFLSQDELGSDEKLKNLENKSKGESNVSKELEQKISELEAKNKELAEQNRALSASLASIKVDSAIFENKLSKEQKSWALKYVSSDPAGFDEFISLSSPKVNLMQNDIYANKASNPANDEFDILKIAKNRRQNG